MRYLVLDISTTARPGIEDSHYLSWANKRGANTPEEAYSKAGLHAEYGMICGLAAYWVDFGSTLENYNVRAAFMGSASGQTEEENLLLDFEKLLDEDVVLVGHNAKDFLIPYLTKRYLGNGLRVPDCILDAIDDGSYYDIMRVLACGGASVLSLRASAFLFGVDDPRADVVSPKIYDLHKAGRMEEIVKLTSQNAKVAAEVFGNCVLGNLIRI